MNIRRKSKINQKNSFTNTNEESGLVDNNNSPQQIPSQLLTGDDDDEKIDKNFNNSKLIIAEKYSIGKSEQNKLESSPN